MKLPKNKYELLVAIILIVLILVSGITILYQQQIIDNYSKGTSIVPTTRPGAYQIQSPTFRKVNGFNTTFIGDRYLRVIAPEGNEKVCFGDNLTIKWQSNGVDTVKLLVNISEGGGDSFEIATFPASFNESGKKDGTGEFLWQVGKLSHPKFMIEGYAYEITAVGYFKNGNSFNYPITDVSDNVFSILNCTG
jgi:hypothetical protein